MAFGILPGNHRLGIPYFKIGIAEEVYSTMNLLDTRHKASNTLKDINRLLIGKLLVGCSVVSLNACIVLYM